MKVVADAALNASADAASVPSAPGSAPRAARRAVSPRPAAQAAEQAQQKAPVAGALQTSITFRRDNHGRIFYVVSDSQSGEEIREVPSEIVRKAGQGIDEFLKRAEAKSRAHLEVKA